MQKHSSKLKKPENHCTPLKLESKKQAEKVVMEQEEGQKVPIKQLGKSHVPPNIRLGVWWEWIGGPPTYYTQTHTLKRKQNAHSRMQKHGSKVKNSSF